MPFDPPFSLTLAFAALTLIVAGADIALVRIAAPAANRARWTTTALIAGVLWLAGHAALAESSILESATMPPPAMPYLLVTILVAIGVAFSRVGAALAHLPLAVLVGLQVFRLPLEVLHELYGAGALPVQMTWSGLNFDVATAVAALAITPLLVRNRLPRLAVWIWNVGGLLLLINVVTIALLSAPLPIRQFHNEPAVVLVFHAPYNWIVNVHVWTALVGHLVIFRALRRSDAEA